MFMMTASPTDFSTQLFKQSLSDTVPISVVLLGSFDVIEASSVSTGYISTTMFTVVDYTFISKRYALIVVETFCVYVNSTGLEPVTLLCKGQPSMPI